MTDSCNAFVGRVYGIFPSIFHLGFAPPLSQLSSLKRKKLVDRIPDHDHDANGSLEFAGLENDGLGIGGLENDRQENDGLHNTVSHYAAWNIFC